MRNPTPTVGRLIFGGTVLALVLAVMVGALFLPVTTAQFQPPPTGQEWIGVPPKVDVECGTLMQPHDPVWPKNLRDRVDPHDASARSGCDDAHGSRQTMAAAFGALGVCVLTLLLFAVRRRRRDLA